MFISRVITTIFTPTCFGIPETRATSEPASISATIFGTHRGVGECIIARAGTTHHGRITTIIATGDLAGRRGITTTASTATHWHVGTTDIFIATTTISTIETR
jgi:hypothetical protein